jgi:hypothetical protein
MSLGSVRYDGVAILGHNSPEWFMAEMAAMYIGGKAAGIILVLRSCGEASTCRIQLIATFSILKPQPPPFLS